MREDVPPACFSSRLLRPAKCCCIWDSKADSPDCRLPATDKRGSMPDASSLEAALVLREPLSVLAPNSTTEACIDEELKSKMSMSSDLQATITTHSVTESVFNIEMAQNGRLGEGLAEVGIKSML